MNRHTFAEALHNASYSPPPIRPIFPDAAYPTGHTPPSSISSSLKTPSAQSAPTFSQSTFSSSLLDSWKKCIGQSGAEPANRMGFSAPLATILKNRLMSSIEHDADQSVHIGTGKNVATAYTRKSQPTAKGLDKQVGTWLDGIVASSSNCIGTTDENNSGMHQPGGEGETRAKLLELQEKYDELLSRLSQTTRNSEAMTAELRAMQENLNRARKGCVTLTDIIKEVANDSFHPYTPSDSMGHPTLTKVAATVSDTTTDTDLSAINREMKSTNHSYDQHHASTARYRAYIPTVEGPGEPECKEYQDTLTGPINALSQSSPDVVLSTATIKTPSPDVHPTLMRTILSGKIIGPSSRTHIPESTNLTEADATTDTYLLHKPLPSLNTSVHSASGSSRTAPSDCSSRASSQRSRGRQPKLRHRSPSTGKRKVSRRSMSISSPIITSLYNMPRQQLPMISELIASTEAELCSFQRHLDDVLEIAKQDPNRTWERGEEIRLLCQAISAKKTALGKLWMLHGETDKALSAIETDIEQMHGLQQKLRTRIAAYPSLRETGDTYSSYNMADIYSTRNVDMSAKNVATRSSPSRRRSSSKRLRTRPRSISTVDVLYPMAPYTRPRALSASKRHEKCVARPVFEPFKARPNPFPYQQLQ